MFCMVSTSNHIKEWFKAVMRCTKCGWVEDKVIDSRASKEGSTIRRRRECLACGHRFTTYELIEHEDLTVIKRDGRTEEFSREKLLAGIKKACQKRPISGKTIEELAAKIIDEISEKFDHELPSLALGERVMEALKGLDEVAYVRFASVYRRFQEANDFVQAVKKLEEHHDPTAS
jgi:transcriptional repressor NrdR